MFRIIILTAILNKAMRTLPMAVPLLNLSPEQSYVDSVPDQPVTLRSYFPETWLWELMPTGYTCLNSSNTFINFGSQIQIDL